MTDDEISLLDEEESDSNIGSNEKALDELSRLLESERDSHKEERFIWIIVLILIVNICIVTNVDEVTIGTAFILLIPEVILILIAANVCNVGIVEAWLNKIINLKSK